MINQSHRRRHVSVSDGTPNLKKPPVLRRAVSWASGSCVPLKQTTPTRRESAIGTTVITPLVKIPSQTRSSLPVNKKISLPVIKPRHETLQTDFYKLQQSLRVLTNGEEGSMVSSCSRVVHPKKYQNTKEHPVSPFDDYLKRLKLKEELPWRSEAGGQGQKAKGDKVKLKDRKVYFRLDIDSPRTQ